VANGNKCHNPTEKEVITVKKSVAILMVALMALTVVSTAGIGSAAPVSSYGRDIIKPVYLERTRIQAGFIRISQRTGQFSIFLNRGVLRLRTNYAVVFRVNGRNDIFVKVFNSDFQRTLILYGRLSRGETNFIRDHPYGQFVLTTLLRRI